VSRRAALAFVFALLALLIVAMARAGNHGDGHTRRFGRGMVAFDGAGPERWSFRYRREHRAVRNLAALVRLQRRQLARLKTGRTLQSATIGGWLVGRLGSARDRAYRCAVRVDGDRRDPAEPPMTDWQEVSRCWVARSTATFIRSTRNGRCSR
jgi:hypothetical protein